MSLRSYPLVSSALGITRAVELTEIAQAAAWALDTWDLRVTLRMSGDGWLVHGPGGYLGLIPTAVTTRYPDLMRVFHSGLAPEVSARIRPAEDGSGRMLGSVDLPAPPFVVPVGRVNSPVLGQGGRLELDLSVDVAAPAQVLVELDAVGDAVVARFHGRLLGAVHSTPASLLDALSTRPLAARAFVADGRAALDVGPELVAEEIPALSAPEPQILRVGAAPESFPLIPLDQAWLDSPEKRR